MEELIKSIERKIEKYKTLSIEIENKNVSIKKDTKHLPIELSSEFIRNRAEIRELNIRIEELRNLLSEIKSK